MDKSISGAHCQKNRIVPINIQCSQWWNSRFFNYFFITSYSGNIEIKCGASALCRLFELGWLFVFVYTLFEILWNPDMIFETLKRRKSGPFGLAVTLGSIDNTNWHKNQLRNSIIVPSITFICQNLISADRLLLFFKHWRHIASARKFKNSW